MLNNKVSIVSGAGAGIGRAIAVDMARNGARIGVLDINPATAMSAVEEIEALGGQAVPHVLDVADEQRVSKAIQDIHAEFGRIDIVVNNAGLSSQHLEETPRATWEKGIQQSLTSAYVLTESCLPFMVEQQTGAITNICSVNGNSNGNNNAWYCAAKAGLAGYTKHLACQWGRYGVRANSICLGLIRTNRTRFLDDDPELLERLVSSTCIGRAGEPDEVAPVATFLSSDMASYITGAMLYVDGGLSVK